MIKVSIDRLRDIRRDLDMGGSLPAVHEMRHMAHELINLRREERRVADEEARFARYAAESKAATRVFLRRVAWCLVLPLLPIILFVTVLLGLLQMAFDATDQNPFYAFKAVLTSWPKGASS